MTGWAAAQHQGRELADLSLEELARLQITSVSKQSESLASAPASAYVITERQVRRTGVSSLAEALRLAPNLQVARINASEYAISARGFNGPYANMLLVLIDGRTVYSPLFSGVFWDAQDVMLEDLDRIEVISGPGATLWGANAVNGVINIKSRPADETQGALASVGSSPYETRGAVRYGGRLGDGHFRVYGIGTDHDGFALPSGTVDGGWYRGQAGFRADWRDDERELTVQGDTYDGEIDSADGDLHITGTNLLARYGRGLDNDSHVMLQMYYDHSEREQAGYTVNRLNVVDLEFQHDLAAVGRHKLTWGAGARHATDRAQGVPLDDTPFMVISPEERKLSTGNLFVQDVYSLSDTLDLTAGIKVDKNPYTGLETLPSVRLGWQPAEAQFWWMALSRAVRAPSRYERDYYVMEPGTDQYRVVPNDEFVSTVANVGELGYRGRLRPDLSWSITGFYADYDRIRTSKRHMSEHHTTVYNGGAGTIFGLETWATWQVSPRWRIHGGMVVQDYEFEVREGASDHLQPFNDPRNYWSLHSSYDLSGNAEFTWSLRHVAEVREAEIPEYTELDLRLGWQLTSSLEVAVVGRNLLNDSHQQWREHQGAEVPRSIFWKLLWTH